MNAGGSIKLQCTVMVLIIHSCWCQQLASDVSDEKLPLAGISK